MKTFSALDELFAAAGTHQITGQELLNSRTHVCGEWQDIELMPNLRNEVINQISELFGARSLTKSYIRHNLRNSHPQHWGLARVVIARHGDGPARLEYITGQDFSWESKIIRTYLAK